MTFSTHIRHGDVEWLEGFRQCWKHALVTVRCIVDVESQGLTGEFVVGREFSLRSLNVWGILTARPAAGRGWGGCSSPPLCRPEIIEEQVAMHAFSLQEIQHASLEPLDLRAITPTCELAKYFAFWWQMQRKYQQNTLLGLYEALSSYDLHNKAILPRVEQVQPYF